MRLGSQAKRNGSVKTVSKLNRSAGPGLITRKNKSQDSSQSGGQVMKINAGAPAEWP